MNRKEKELKEQESEIDQLMKDMADMKRKAQNDNELEKQRDEIAELKMQMEDMADIQQTQKDLIEEFKQQLEEDEDDALLHDVNGDQKKAQEDDDDDDDDGTGAGKRKPFKKQINFPLPEYDVSNRTWRDLYPTPPKRNENRS